MSVLTSLTRFSLRWSSSRRALSVLALLLAAPGYICQADQPSPASVEADKNDSVSSPVMNVPLMELKMLLPLTLIGLFGIVVYSVAWEKPSRLGAVVVAWMVVCFCNLVQHILEEALVSLSGRWVEAATHARMKAIHSRVNGVFPYGSWLWHIAVSMMAGGACYMWLEKSERTGFIILAGTCLAVGMRTLWLYIRARRERSHAEAAGKQQA